MKEYEKKKFFKNLIVIVIIAIVFGIVAVVSMMKQQGSKLGEAGNPNPGGIGFGFDSGTMIQSEEVTEYHFEYVMQGNHYIGAQGTEWPFFPEGSYQFDVGNGTLSFQIYEAGELIDEWTLSREEGYERFRDHVEVKEGQLLVVTGPGNGSALADEKTTMIKDLIGDHDKERLKLEPGSYVVGDDISVGLAYFYLEGEGETTIAVSEPARGGVNITLAPQEGSIGSHRYCNVILREGDVLTIEGDRIGCDIYKNIEIDQLIKE